MTAARVTLGAICLSSSSHFPLMPYSNGVNPVALPPGRARLSTKPAPTGSGTYTNTIGTARVACSNGPTVALPCARMTSGASATNSTAYLRMRSASPPPQRVSIRTLRPTVQPNCCSPCRNAATRACASGSSAVSHEHADAPHPVRLLRARGERPRRCCPAEKRDELPPLQMIGPHVPPWVRGHPTTSYLKWPIAVRGPWPIRSPPGDPQMSGYCTQETISPAAWVRLLRCCGQQDLLATSFSLQETQTKHGGVRRAGDIEYWAASAELLVRFDIRCPDHLAPLLAVLGDELSELCGRARQHHGAKFGKPRLDPGIGESGVDLFVDLVDNLSRRVLGCAEAQPRVRPCSRARNRPRAEPLATHSNVLQWSPPMAAACRP